MENGGMVDVRDAEARDPLAMGAATSVGVAY